MVVKFLYTNKDNKPLRKKKVINLFPNWWDGDGTKLEGRENQPRIHKGTFLLCV